MVMVRILLAEDDSSMREYLQRALQRVGYEVEAVGCGTEAVPLLAPGKFDLLTYVALGAFRRDMESACDRSVLATPGACDPRSYGETILRSAARPIPRSLCALTSLDELKGRLIMLNNDKGRIRQIAGFGLALTLAAGGMALAGPAAAEESNTKTVTEKRVVITNDKGQRVELDGDRKLECPGQKTTVEAAPTGTADKKEAAKIVICSKGGGNAEVAAGLERALSDMEKNSDMNPAIKADLSAKLRAKIAELRGQ